MTIAAIVWKVFLGIGVIAAIVIPFVPSIVEALISLPQVKTMGDAMGQAFAVLFYWALLALVALVASIVAMIAANSAHEQSGTIILCGLPIVLAVTTSFGTWLFLFGK